MNQTDITIVDYFVTRNNPAGSCHLNLINELHDDFAFRVIAVDIDPSLTRYVRFTRLPALRRPLALLFISFHIMFKILRLFRRDNSRISQAIESNVLSADVVYAHFCHRAYLDRTAWQRSWRPRALAKHLNHILHAALEPHAYRSARLVVTPSRGLKSELEEVYPFVREKTRVVPNPVDVQHMSPPKHFDPRSVRDQFGASDEDRVIVFIALGHFERKGLAELLEAVSLAGDPRLRVVVVGGDAGMLRIWKKLAADLGIGKTTSFVGFKEDVRPFLWAADAFALPSEYEVFPLVALEAAASGLPLVVTKLHGVEEFMVDGRTGFVVERDASKIAAALKQLANMEGDEIMAMGQSARAAVQEFNVRSFAERWRSIYAELA